MKTHTPGFREIGGYDKLIEKYLSSAYIVKKKIPPTPAAKTTVATTIINNVMQNNHTINTTNLMKNMTKVFSLNNTIEGLSLGNVSLSPITSQLGDFIQNLKLPLNMTHFSATTSTNLLINLYLHTLNSTETSTLVNSFNQSNLILPPNQNQILHTTQNLQNTFLLQTTMNQWEHTTSTKPQTTHKEVTEALVLNTNTRNKNSTCGYPPANSYHLLRDFKDDVFPWPGLFTLTIMSIWYWCSDQVVC